MQNIAFHHKKLYVFVSKLCYIGGNNHQMKIIEEAWAKLLGFGHSASFSCNHFTPKKLRYHPKLHTNIWMRLITLILTYPNVNFIESRTYFIDEHTCIDIL